jgi:hypothetical protein
MLNLGKPDLGKLPRFIRCEPAVRSLYLDLGIVERWRYPGDRRRGAISPLRLGGEEGDSLARGGIAPSHRG